MLRELFKNHKIINTFWQLVILVCFSVIIITMLITAIPIVEAMDKKPGKSIPKGTRYVWYNGHRKEQVWMSEDEIAVFKKHLVRRSKDSPENTLKDLGSSGEVIEENDFVTYLKLSNQRNRTRFKAAIEEPQNKELAQGISPVFYPGTKDQSTRMALTGEMIIHFYPDWSKERIDTWLKDKGLTKVKSFTFSPNTWLVDGGSPLKSLELANDFYLSGEVVYAYPNWLKTRVTRQRISQGGLSAKQSQDKGKKIKEREKRSEIPLKEESKEPGIDTSPYQDQDQAQEKDIDLAGLDHTRTVTGLKSTCYPWPADFWTGSTSGSRDGYKNIYIEGENGYEGVEMRGFAKFDLNKIPDGSTINDVELHVYCYKDIGSPYVDIKKLTSDPVTASWETIFEEAGSGTLYFNNRVFSAGYGSGQWVVMSLGYTAARDLEKSLAQDWFALGFVQDDYSTYNYSWCYGSASISYRPYIVSYRPYIVVDYNPPPVCEDDDPLFPLQWHLKNTGQCGGVIGEDVNISAVWSLYQGDNVVIAIVDDGLEIAHEDLAENIIELKSWDYVDGDKDPSPKGLSETGAHGTACGGIAAAIGWNCLGGRGAAPFCGLVGHRLLGALTDENEADALIRNKDLIDIYSNSWGVPDGQGRLDGPDPLTEAAMAEGVANGRGGLGNIYVWAGGNGGDAGDNSNYDGYPNSRYTIAVGACNDSGIGADYSEKGANILVNAPAGDSTCGLTTTERTGLNGSNPGNYTSQFTGTSSATPLVAGIIALMLEANPALTWRDVQHILAKTAAKNDPTDPDWTINGAGYHLNHKYGFGRIDAEAAIEAVSAWTSVEREQSIEISSSPYKAIPDNNTSGVSDTIKVNANLKIEFIEIYFRAADHEYWGDLEIELISPMGTKSILAEKHLGDENYTYDNWRFGTVRHFGEDSAGIWTLRVKDLASSGDWGTLDDSGTLQSWTIKIYGYTDCSNNYPQLTCPGEIIVPTDPGICTASKVDLGTPIITDNCDPNKTMVGNDAPSVFLRGTTTVIWTAKNVAGNESSCIQEVKVEDNEPPQLICPDEITVSYDPGMYTDSNVDLGTFIVTDNCDPPPTVSNYPLPPYPLGLNTVTWTAQDASGNTATCDQTVDSTPNDMGADGGPWGVQDTDPPLIDEISIQINGIMVTPPIMAKISEEVCFTAEASDEWGMAGYSWDFDASDGIQEDSRGKETCHAYEDEGNYTITLTVEDNNGLKSSQTEEIIITPKDPPEILSILTSPPCGNEPLNVLFKVNAQDPDGPIVSYQWDFNNDGIYDLETAHANTAFTFSDPNLNKSVLREIRVCVTDNDGFKTCGTTSITLVPAGYQIVRSATIGIEGGELEVSEPACGLNGVKVTISPNTLNKNFTIIICKIDTCPFFPQQVQGIGCPMELGPSIDFQFPVTITIPYDNNELKEHGNSHEEDLKMYSLDTSKSVWSPVEDTYTDYENQNISAKVNHFSLFKIGYEKRGNLKLKGTGCFITTCFPKM